jgi:hypothetical protein
VRREQALSAGEQTLQGHGAEHAQDAQGGDDDETVHGGNAVPRRADRVGLSIATLQIGRAADPASTNRYKTRFEFHPWR